MNALCSGYTAGGFSTAEAKAVRLFAAEGRPPAGVEEAGP